MVNELIKMADDANNGLQNALKVYIDLKRIEKTLSDCLESVKEGAIAEANKYPQKSFELNGAKIEKKKSASRYIYSNIPQWVRAKGVVTQLEALAKQSYEANKKGLSIIDSDGIIVPCPEFREGDDTIAITLL